MEENNNIRKQHPEKTREEWRAEYIIWATSNTSSRKQEMEHGEPNNGGTS